MGGRVLEGATAPSRRTMRPAPLGPEKEESKTTAAGQRSPPGRRTEKRRQREGRKEKRRGYCDAFFSFLLFYFLAVGMAWLCPRVWAFASV